MFLLYHKVCLYPLVAAISFKSYLSIVGRYLLSRRWSTFHCSIFCVVRHVVSGHSPHFGSSHVIT